MRRRSSPRDHHQTGRCCLAAVSRWLGRHLLGLNALAGRRPRLPVPRRVSAPQRSARAARSPVSPCLQRWPSCVRGNRGSHDSTPREGRQRRLRPSQSRFLPLEEPPPFLPQSPPMESLVSARAILGAALPASLIKGERRRHPPACRRAASHRALRQLPASTSTKPPLACAVRRSRSHRRDGRTDGRTGPCWAAWPPATRWPPTRRYRSACAPPPSSSSPFLSTPPPPGSATAWAGATWPRPAAKPRST